MTEPSPAALVYARRRQAQLIAWLQDHGTVLAYEQGQLCFAWDRKGMTVQVETLTREAVPQAKA